MNVRDDPEMFAIYGQLSASARRAFNALIERLIVQMSAIISDGIRCGEFHFDDTGGAACSINGHVLRANGRAI